MRSLQIGDRPTKLAQAVAELGRIDKTIHALTYIDDETKRRRILNQLNKGEDRHVNKENYGSDTARARKISSERWG